MKKGQVSHKNTPYTFKGLCWLLLGLYMNDDLFSQETITLGSKHPASTSFADIWLDSLNFHECPIQETSSKTFSFLL